MTYALADRTAIVGVGRTTYTARGRSVGRTAMDLAIEAVLAACADAGLSVDEVDGFSLFGSKGFDVALAAQHLGIPQLRFAATVPGGGGGSAAAVGLAAAAISSGMASVVVTVLALRQPADRRSGAGAGVYAEPATPESDFTLPAGLVAPGQMFALLARRHMHLYGTLREHLAEVAISTRANAVGRESALMRDPLTLDEYLGSRMVSDPLCLFDFCLESEGAVAIVTTAADRARDLRQRPVYVRASASGGSGAWGQGIAWMGMPDDIFASSGHRSIAADTWARAGLKPADVDVAMIYDHFTIAVLLQLEDYGFCGVGESGPFVADGNIRRGGTVPVNTHGGHLSEAYLMGITHVVEAVEQLRGVAVNQVVGAQVALVTGGPGSLPVSSLVLMG